MPRVEFQVCTLRSTHTDKKHSVLVWPGYGVVAPSLWTTNGSAQHCAELIHGHVAAGNYILEDACEALNAASVSDLCAQLIVIYRRFSS